MECRPRSQTVQLEEQPFTAGSIPLITSADNSLNPGLSHSRWPDSPESAPPTTLAFTHPSHPIRKSPSVQHLKPQPPTSTPPLSGTFPPSSSLGPRGGAGQGFGLRKAGSSAPAAGSAGMGGRSAGVGSQADVLGQILGWGPLQARRGEGGSAKLGQLPILTAEGEGRDSMGDLPEECEWTWTNTSSTHKRLNLTPFNTRSGLRPRLIRLRHSPRPSKQPFSTCHQGWPQLHLFLTLRHRRPTRSLLRPSQPRASEHFPRARKQSPLDARGRVVRLDPDGPRRTSLCQEQVRGRPSV